MFVHIPDHFSKKLRFDMDKLPAIVTDQHSIIWGILGLFFGILLLWLGIFEFFSFIKADASSEQSFLMVEIFALIVIFIALTIVVCSIFSFIRYKKFYFDGTNFQMIYRPAMGIKHKFSEPLANYMGVRLRVLFTQSGLINKRRYVIDLYHQDNNKIVPLYISTKDKNIRKIWEGYAKLLKLPALSVGERGLVQRDYKDLDKSLKELNDLDKLPFIASGRMPAPQSINVKEAKNSIEIKPKRIFWDIFSILSILTSFLSFFILFAGCFYLIIVGADISIHYLILGIVLFISGFYFMARVLSFYTLKLMNDRVVVSETICGFKITENDLSNSAIENIELSYNPITSRYDLAIVSDEKILNFNSRLPVGDLIWLKDFVIRKLIGN